MGSVALPIGWELWWQSRWWALPWLACLLLLALLSWATPGVFLSAPLLAAVGGLSFSGAYVLLLVLVTYSLGSDLAARASGFPARMFALPARTTALVFWPMLYGALAAGLMWAALAALVLWPCGLDVPLLWPALVVAAFTGWFQAVAWWPFGWPWVRLVASVGLLTAVVTTPALYQDGIVPEWVMAAVSAALLPAAYLTSVAGVARARRGDGQEWPSPARLLRRLLPALPRRGRPFASASGALLWWEWRRNALGLVVLLGASYAVFLVPPLLLGHTDVLPLWRTVVLLVFVPVLLAGMSGVGLGKFDSREKTAGLSSFQATRPVTGAQIIAAKLRAAALATLATWALASLLVPLSLARADNAAEAARWWGLLLQVYPAWKAYTIAVLMVVGLVALTWRQMVVNLYIGLAGRKWVDTAVVLTAVALLIGLGVAGQWVAGNPEVQEMLWRAAPWVPRVAVALKLLLAAWALRALYRRRLVEPRILVRLLAAWLLVTALLFAALAWLLPRVWVSLPGVALGAVLVVPLARLALAPLALEWNRHR